MAPISLKDPNIQAITEEFVKTVTGFKKSSRNFTVSVQFALSNFRYHQFLDVNSTKVMRNIDGVCQKLKVHSQSEKAGILRNLCDRFLELPLNESSKDVKTDTHYSLLLLLLTLADSPTNAEYVQPLQEETSEEESFDWKSYLLDGEEEEILGIPSNQYQEDDLEVTGDSGVSLGEHQALLAKNRQGSFHHDNTDTRIEFDTLKPSIRDRSWIKDQIVDQYWEKSFDTHNNAQESESRNCSVAKTWESYQRECNPFYSRNYNITLTETQIVRETLWMLYGVKNTFVYKEMCQEVLTVIDNIQVLHLTPESLASLLSSFLEAGQQCHLLQRFVSSVLNPQSESTQTSQAFASALSCHFKDYKAFLSSIEKDIIKQEDSVTLLILQNKLKSRLDEINTLFFVYQAISEDTMKLSPAQRTCKLLNTLYSTIVQTDALGSAAKWKVCLLLKVFLQTVEPCLCFINEWVTSGWVCDPHNEFFIQRIHDISVDSVKFWSDGVILRCSDHPQNPVVPCFLLTVINQIFPAVKSVELTCGLGKMTEYLSKSIKGSLYQTFLDALLTSLSLNLASEENNACGNNEDNGCLLDAITSSDQVLSVIKETGDHVLKLAFMNVSPLSSSSLAYQSATAGKVTRICSGVSKLLKPVNLLITGCLTPLIEECCLQASSSAVKLMREHFCLLDHLAAMRNFFLLEAGDAMHQFYVQIFYKARRHETWQDISFLNSLMQEALQPRFPKAIERLVVNLSGNTSSSTNRKQGNKSLQGLALNYKAPWPVNIIIDSSCQKLYNLVFLFLLKLKQAKWSLDELRFSELQGGNSFQEKGDYVDEEENKSQAQSLSNLASARPASPVNEHVLHKMFLLRFKLLQFINSIHTHFMTRILHSTGLEFQKALDQAKNLDDLIKAHSTYVEKLYDRCLLSQKVGHLREVILKVLNLVLLFQSYWDNGAHNMSVDKFKKMDEEFTKCNTFLVSCLANIVKRGAFPHLESLAFALSSSPSVPSTS
ncbi:gamma-tubulin complex component 5-like isoform X2 [Montipora capricornis]|uniref:gamma-tubulin complex component 5-like isoform X2 n=1 Tax=Montipora capricornis TaxID=246305 RepID=UPI0035F1ED5F